MNNNYLLIAVAVLGLLVSGIWYFTLPTEVEYEKEQKEYEKAPVVPIDTGVIGEDLGDGKG